MSPARSRPRRLTRGLAALGVLAALLVGLPVALVVLSRQLLGSPNPLHGVTPPWTWTRTGIVDTLTTAVDQDTTIDTLARIGLVVAWLALAVLAATVAVELVAQRRHGEPLPRMRGLAPFQALAQPLVAGLLSLSTMIPTHLAAAADLPTRTPVATQPAVPPAAVPPAAAPAMADDEWRPYTVVKGDSIYGIAGRLAGGDPARTRDLARRILDRNLGRAMGDGQRFTTPGYIETGWRLDLPASTPPAHTAAPDGSPAPSPPLEPPGEVYVVQRGDSYWEIAEDHLEQLLGHEPTEGQVLDHTRQLVAYNAPLLGNRTPAHLIHPGDHVHLVTPANGTPRNGTTPAQAVAPPPSAEPPPVAAVDDVPVDSVAAPPAMTVASSPVEPRAAPAHEPLEARPLPPTARAEPTTEAPEAEPLDPGVAADSDATTNPWAGIALTSVFATGATTAIVRFRRRRLARRRPGTRLAPSSARARTAAVAVHAAAQPDRIALLRQLLGGLAGHYRLRPADALIRATQIEADHVELLWTAPQIYPPAGWTTTDGGWSWRHPWSDPTSEPSDPVCVAPALVAVGTRDDAELLLDLETAGSLAITGHPTAAAGLARQITLTLAASPLGGLRDVILIGHNEQSTRHLEQARTASLSDTIRWITARADDQRRALHDARAATVTGARLLGRPDDPWDALVAVVALDGLTSDEKPFVAELIGLCAPGSGFATLLLGDHPQANDRITCGGPDHAVWTTAGVSFRPATLPADAATDLDDLLDHLATADDEPCQPPVVEPVEAAAVVHDLHAEVDRSSSSDPGESPGAVRHPYEVLVWASPRIVEASSMRRRDARTTEEVRRGLQGGGGPDRVGHGPSHR